MSREARNKAAPRTVVLGIRLSKYTVLCAIVVQRGRLGRCTTRMLSYLDYHKGAGGKG